MTAIDTPEAIPAVAVWNAFGAMPLTAGAGLYGLWFWLRETYRLPRFLRWWEETRVGDAPIVSVEDLPRR